MPLARANCERRPRLRQTILHRTTHARAVQFGSRFVRLGIDGPFGPFRGSLQHCRRSMTRRTHSRLEFHDSLHHARSTNQRQFLQRPRLPAHAGRRGHRVAGVPAGGAARRSRRSAISTRSGSSTGWRPRGARISTRSRRGTPLPIDHPFSWGTIRIVDRLEVRNEYVTFGGRLSAARIDGVHRGRVRLARADVARQSATLRPRTRRRRASRRSSLGYAPPPETASTSSDASSGSRPRAGMPRTSPMPCDTYRRSQLLQLSHPHTWQSLMRQERRLRAERPSAWSEGLGLLPILRVASNRIGSEKEARRCSCVTRW